MITTAYWRIQEGRQGHAVQFLLFSCNCGKNWPNNRLGSLPESWRPLLWEILNPSLHCAFIRSVIIRRTPYSALNQRSIKLSPVIHHAIYTFCQCKLYHVLSYLFQIPNKPKLMQFIGSHLFFLVILCYFLLI